MNVMESKLTFWDVLRYMFAYGLWIALSGVAGVLILLLREPVRQLMTLSLAGDPYYRLHVTEAGGLISSVDRFGLIVFAIIWVVYLIFTEESLRAAVAGTRDRRVRARLAAEPPVAVIPASRLERLGLDLLAQRLPRLALFPAILLGIWLLLVVAIQLSIRL